MALQRHSSFAVVAAFIIQKFKYLQKMKELPTSDPFYRSGNAAKLPVSRSAEYSDLFRKLTDVVTAAYCRLDKGEADEWFNEAKEKIDIFQVLNSAP